MRITYVLKTVSLCYLPLLISVALTSVYLLTLENTECFRLPKDSLSPILTLQEQQRRGANYSFPEAESLVTLYKSYVNYTFCTGNISKCLRYSLNDSESYHVFLQRFNAVMRKGSYLKAFINNTGTTSSQRFHRGINQYYLYHPDDVDMVSGLLKDLNSQPVVYSEELKYGTQIKLVLTLADGSQALFKPMRFPRGEGDFPNLFYFEDYERHTSEIAAFHLDRILGFHRVPPTVGRLLNLTRDVKLLNKDLRSKFYISPDGNQCFRGSCSQYCKEGFPVCGSPELIEGSATAFLPNPNVSSWSEVSNPYENIPLHRPYVKWERDTSYCDTYLKHPTRKWLPSVSIPNLIDMSVLDFIMGNMDRHNFNVFNEFGNETFMIHLDHGRGFGKVDRDPKSCLAAIQQCCTIRFSTLAKLIKLYHGPESLSQVLRNSLTSDPLNPILLEPQLDAVDRRVAKILKAVRGCLAEGRPWETVVMDDDTSTQKNFKF